MTDIIGALLIVIAILAAAVVALLLQRTRSHRVEKELREREERFRLLADRAPVMMWTARPDSTLDFLNATCVEFTGMPLEQLLNEGWLSAVHPDDVAHCTSVYVPAVEAHRPFVVEYRLRRADGDYRWVLDTGVPKYGAGGRHTGFIGCCVDITERRNAEDGIRESQAALEVSHRQIQHLAGRLIEAQDAERARIARDLHDDVSQQLAGMSIAFSGLKQRLADANIGDDVRDDLRVLHQRTSTLAQNVRHLSHDLHPTVLRHAGLVAALTAYCAELERTHGTGLSCRAEGDFVPMAPDVALCLYRIAQESLRNVIAHACARRADVELVCTAEHATMTITDDGKGFDVDRAFERSTGLGLVSITERVKLARGTVSIAADESTGTRVRVQIPTHAGVSSEPDQGPSRASREYSLS